LQREALTAAARSAEASLAAELASERVAAQEARHALQALSASNASAVARVAELEVRVRSKSGARATLAAGAAVMAAVQQEVAVLKAVVGSERQEHRQLGEALRTALGQAQRARQEAEEREEAEQGRRGQEREEARREQQQVRGKPARGPTLVDRAKARAPWSGERDQSVFKSILVVLAPLEIWLQRVRGCA
jgi:hypothetical protein